MASRLGKEKKCIMTTKLITKASREYIVKVEEEKQSIKPAPVESFAVWKNWILNKRKASLKLIFEILFVASCSVNRTENQQSET